MGAIRDILFGPPHRRVNFGPDSPIDWHAGDTAVCRYPSIWTDCDSGERSSGPDKGQRCLVTKVELFDGVQFLELAGYLGRCFGAASFYRLDPGAREVDEAVIERLPKPKHARRLKESV